MTNYYLPQQTWGTNSPQFIPQQYTPIPIKEPETNSFVWIQGGKAAAQAYPVAPGNDVLLRDSEQPVIYLKSTDKNGKPQPMQTYRIVEEEEADEKPIMSEFIKKDDLNDYVKREDLDDVFKELQGIKDTLLDIQTRPESSDNNNRRCK